VNVATWSIDRPVPVILLFVVLCFTGLWSWKQLHTQNIPDLEMPTINVSLTQSGSSPARLESEVARKVEDVLAGLQGIKHIETSITEGEVSIKTRFALDKPISTALIEVKDAVDRIRSSLPDDLDPPDIASDVAFDAPLLTYAVASTGLNEGDLSWFVDDRVSKTLMSVAGVGRVERVGGLDREVLIEVDPAQLNAHGVTAAEVSRALKLHQLDVSGGQVELGGGEQALRVAASARLASELQSLQLPMADGRQLRLDQLARVSDGAAPRLKAARLDGKPAVGFHIFRAVGQDEIAMQEGVRQAIADLSASSPSVSFTLIADKVEYTREQYKGSMNMLLEGAVLAVLVVWWFLKDWRATLVAAAALPLSIIPVFAAMHWLGFSLNTLTLLALAVVVGILVDDAIVEVENIVRHVRMGKPVRLAAVEAVQEIALAVVATTLTLVVVFVPTSMMNSVPGLFFREFGWTAAIAVLFSLAVARLLTPLMAVHLLSRSPAHHEKDSRWMCAYMDAVRWCVRHRLTTAALAIAFFLASLALVPLIPTGLLPASDQNDITVHVELAPGSSIEQVMDASESARRLIAGTPGVRSVLTAVSADSGDMRKGSLLVALNAPGTRPSQREIEANISTALMELPGARVSIGGGQDDKALELILASEDSAALYRSAKQLEQELRGLPSLANVQSTASMERPEVVVLPDMAHAAELGVSSQAMADTMRIATAGDRDRALPKLGLDTREVPMVVRVPESVRQDLDALRALRVLSRAGPIPISSVARVDLSSGPAKIERYDRQRFVKLTASLGATSLGTAVQEARALPAARQLPDGVQLIDAGNAENMNDLVSGFGFAMTAGLVCVYCVLVLLFSSFVQPVTILSALPLSVGGAFVALLLTQGELNIPSLIGLVMLMGVATKNSILLVEYAMARLRDREMSPIEAIVDACHKRARPIVMTTLAMTAGMLPIALGLGADASFRQPMAVAVIGGLFTSTALSLLVVPVVFLAVLGGTERAELLIADLRGWRWSKAKPL
jgi:multidrug efflux pump subunit AcrB